MPFLCQSAQYLCGGRYHNDCKYGRSNSQSPLVPKVITNNLARLLADDRYCENLLKAGRHAEAAALVSSDTELARFVQIQVRSGRDRLRNVCGAVDLIHVLHTGKETWTDIYVRAMNGDLSQPEALDGCLDVLRVLNKREILLSITRLSSCAQIPDQLRTACSQLQQFCSDSPDQDIRSLNQLSNAGVTTTVIGQKVELAKAPAALSIAETKFADLVRDAIDLLAAHLTEMLKSPRLMPLHEVLLYEAGSPYRHSHHPRPRHAIERGLSTPSHYLMLGGSGLNPQSGPEPSWPAIALLHQLHLEAGALINVGDMWIAYCTVMSTDEHEEMDDDRRKTLLALFTRALAELRYLGIIKPTTRKNDQYAKVFSQGL